MKNKKYLSFYLFSCVVIYTLIYIPAFYTPFHSDDYLFLLQGVDLNIRLNHYLHWCGRFITDYTSSLLLSLFSKWAYMAINSFVF